MSTQVYAIVHDGKGNILIATKNKKGYFFSTDGGRTNGAIIPSGQKLNGGGKEAFPGGGLKGDLVEGAALEFWEETNVDISDFDPDITPKPFHGVESRNLDYYGVYFLVSTEQLLELCQIVDGALLHGKAAAQAVSNGTYKKGEYKQLMADYPKSPIDNELETAAVWDIKKPGVWAQIQKWKGTKDQGWFYNILLNLRSQLG